MEQTTESLSASNTGGQTQSEGTPNQPLENGGAQGQQTATREKAESLIDDALKSDAPFEIPETLTDDNRAALYKAMGVPEEASGYELSFKQEDHPEVMFNDDHQSKFKEAMHKANLSPEQADILLGEHLGFLKGAMDQADEGVKQGIEEAKADLKKEWGGEYDTNLQNVVGLIQNYGGEEMIALVQETPLGNQKALLNMLSKLAKEVGEDTLTTGDSRGNGKTQTPMDFLKNEDNSAAYRNSNHPRHAEVRDAMEGLYKSQYGVK